MSTKSRKPASRHGRHQCTILTVNAPARVCWTLGIITLFGSAGCNPDATVVHSFSIDDSVILVKNQDYSKGRVVSRGFYAGVGEQFFPEKRSQFIHRHGIQEGVLFGELVEYPGDSVSAPPTVLGFFVFRSDTRNAILFETAEELNDALNEMGIADHTIDLQMGNSTVIQF